MAGFAPIPDDILRSLGTITGDNDLLPVRKMEVTQLEGEIVSTSGSYYMEETNLPRHLYHLLHGRAYIMDRDPIPNITSSSPKTYYVAANKHKGLIIPGRSLFIESINSKIYYRWTDDGIKWTEWISLSNPGMWHSYDINEKCRFGEIQVYTNIPNSLINVRCTR